ncbi:MAG: glutaredoxin, partial [Desulfurococcaceae archaeon]
EAFEHPYEADKYMVQYVPFIAITRIEDYEIYGARPVETIPGYLPPEDIVVVLKRAERKIRQMYR